MTSQMILLWEKASTLQIGVTLGLKQAVSTFLSQLLKEMMMAVLYQFQSNKLVISEGKIF